MLPHLLLIRITIFVLLLAAAGLGQGVVYTGEAELKEQIAAVPCVKNSERLTAVRDLFIKAGATTGDIKIHQLKDVDNLVITKPGKTAETVIIGAHYDRTNEGCGAIDNWSGIVIIANIYRTLRPLNTDKTYVFVAFGREEEGLVGSTAMANQIKKEDRTNYCAMVNFDSFGFTYPQGMRNISSKPLLDLAQSVSKDLKLPYADASIEFASSDSAPFIAKGIPAISLHGLSDRWQEYLHRSSDKVGNVNIGSVNVGYRHGVYLLAKIEASACGAFGK